MDDGKGFIIIPQVGKLDQFLWCSYWISYISYGQIKCLVWKLKCWLLLILSFCVDFLIYIISVYWHYLIIQSLVSTFNVPSKMGRERAYLHINAIHSLFCIEIRIMIKGLVMLMLLFSVDNENPLTSRVW